RRRDAPGLLARLFRRGPARPGERDGRRARAAPSALRAGRRVAVPRARADRRPVPHREARWRLGDLLWAALRLPHLDVPRCLAAVRAGGQHREAAHDVPLRLAGGVQLPRRGRPLRLRGLAGRDRRCRDDVHVAVRALLHAGRGTRRRHRAGVTPARAGASGAGSPRRSSQELRGRSSPTSASPPALALSEDRAARDEASAEASEPSSSEPPSRSLAESAAPATASWAFEATSGPFSLTVEAVSCATFVAVSLAWVARRCTSGSSATRWAVRSSDS